MTKRTRWCLIGVILLFIVGMIIYPRIKQRLKTNSNNSVGGNAGRQQHNALNINAIIMKPQSMVYMRTVNGDIIADEEVDLSFETSGKITNIYFKEGAHVRKGELLAKINDQPLQAQLKRLEAQIPLAKDKVYRQKTLLEKDAVSKEAYESVTTEYDILMADIELVKANIAQTELRAPFDGIIGLRNVSEGAYTTQSTAITKLTKIKPIKVEVSVPETYADDIKPGTDLLFTLQNANEKKEYHAKVYAIESEIDLSTRTLTVRATYPNDDESLKPGRYAHFELTSKKIPDALAIPSEAMIMETGKNTVYLYKSGKAEPIEVEIGLRDEEKVQITKGISAGDTVIISGIMQLRMGMAVTIDNLN